MPEHESELGLIVHQRHQLAGDVNITARHGEGIFDRAVERGEAKRLARIGDARIGRDPPSDPFDIGRTSTGFGTAIFLDQFGVLALRLDHFALVQASHLRLHGDRHQDSRTGGEQKNGAAHIHSVRMGKFLRHERAAKRNCSGAMA